MPDDLPADATDELLTILQYCVSVTNALFRFLQCFDTVGWVTGRASRL